VSWWGEDRRRRKGVEGPDSISVVLLTCIARDGGRHGQVVTTLVLVALEAPILLHKCDCEWKTVYMYQLDDSVDCFIWQLLRAVGFRDTPDPPTLVITLDKTLRYSTSN
jgi:hypothetical protein